MLDSDNVIGPLLLDDGGRIQRRGKRIDQREKEGKEEGEPETGRHGEGGREREREQAGRKERDGGWLPEKGVRFSFFVCVCAFLFCFLGVSKTAGNRYKKLPSYPIMTEVYLRSVIDE